MRERLSQGGEKETDFRITPAYAGKTLLRRVDGAGREDHPRVCGKDSKLPSVSFNIGGSPPRMRERRTVYALLLDPLGITPAYAGKTLGWFYFPAII